MVIRPTITATHPLQTFITSFMVDSHAMVEKVPVATVAPK